MGVGTPRTMDLRAFARLHHRHLALARNRPSVSAILNAYLVCLPLERGKQETAQLDREWRLGGVNLLLPPAIPDMPDAGLI